MELSLIYSRASAGIEAPLVQVETHLANGLPAFNIVGLPETAVRESKDRVRCAILNSHFQFPDRRITVNLAPAELPKEGGRFDLAIALGILAASKQIADESLSHYEFLAELALDGSLRASPAVIPAAQACTEAQRRLVCAKEVATLAAHVPNSQIIAPSELLRLCAHLNGQAPLAPLTSPAAETQAINYPDLAEVYGQAQACRALELAASGGHNLLLCGPPGTGKTLLASRLPGLLPDLSPQEALSCATIHSLQRQHIEHLYQRPFRQPHHSASAAALVGGGRKPQPGEVSLAHCGVLFLDELPEFNRHVLEVLREPLEAGEITLSRAEYKFTFPARFQLVAAMNPCPCGYLGDRDKACRCTPEQVQRYHQRISGPLLDRIDLQVSMQRVPAGSVLRQEQRGEHSALVKQRVAECRDRQMQRQGCSNSELAAEALLRHCQLGATEMKDLEHAADRLQLSVRALHRSLRVARTLADMSAEAQVQRSHIAEALAYREPAVGLSYA